MDLLMTDYIGDELAPKIIRVKGADRKFTLRRKDTNGDPVDWPTDVYLSIDIDKTSPTRVDAVVTAELALVRIESTVADQVKNSTTWQAIMSEAGSPTLETAIAVGYFQRQDGPKSA
jgi:hypothetical protein